MLEKKYDIKRYDLSEDKSLRAWSAADEYLLQYMQDLKQKPISLTIYNDRFGFLGSQLHEASPTIILTHKGQEKAINDNFRANYIPLPTFALPLSSLETEMDFALLKMPKSLGLFRLYLEQISQNSTHYLLMLSIIILDYMKGLKK